MAIRESGPKGFFMTTVLQHLAVEPLTPHVGAVIHDIDLAQADDDEVAIVRQALHRHNVVFFRNQQHVGWAEQIDFARRFGEVTPAHPVFPGTVEGHPEVHFPGYFQPKKGTIAWGGWHTDCTCFERPPGAALLRITEQPEVGGDTLWASTQAAYERLDPSLQRRIDGLVASHSGERQFGPYLREHGPGFWEHEAVDTVTACHPVVRVHPENGRRSIFVNPGFTTHIVGLPAPESDALLAQLYEHITRPEHAVRWRWAPGDLAFWDNRATLHYAVADYDTARRVGRVTLSGERPLGPADVEAGRA
jgi:alpha-ketoglutarate-dependent taurine dioxygenase